MPRTIVLFLMGAVFSFACGPLLPAGAAPGQTEATRAASILFFASRSNSSRSNIFVMNPDGSNLTNLSRVFAGGAGPLSNVREMDPVWSPDGKQIAFSALTRAGQGDIYVMQADGTGRQRLTQLPQLAACPAWSPDGRRLAFGVFSAAGRAKTDIYVMDADGSHLTRPGAGFLPQWSPSGQQLLYTVIDRPGPPLLYIMDADGTHARQFIPGSAAMGTWSPDGRQIAYIAADDKTDAALHLHVMNADTSGRRRLPTLPGSMEFSPQWSPDGQHICFTSQLRGQSLSTIYVMDADGQNLTPLTPPETPAYLSAGVLTMMQGQLDDSPRHLRQLGAALYAYAVKHDGALPPLRDQQALTNALLPYLDDAAVLQQPDTATPYGWNTNLSAQVLADFTPAAAIIIAYEAVPNAARQRHLLFLDGHVARVAEAEWLHLKAASAIP